MLCPTEFFIGAKLISGIFITCPFCVDNRFVDSSWIQVSSGLIMCIHSIANCLVSSSFLKKSFGVH